MTTALKQVMERAERLDPDTQKIFIEEAQRLVDAVTALNAVQWRALAAQIQQVIDAALANRRWDELLSDPRGLDALHRMAQEAVAEYERGETEEGGFGE